MPTVGWLLPLKCFPDPAMAFPTREQVVMAPALLAIFAGAAIATGAGPIDDSFIFLRYARNIFEGRGPVFNPGERVEGFTSPLWTALLVPLFAIGPDPAAFAWLLSGAIGLATVFVVVRRRGHLNGLVLVSNPAFVYWSLSGMETAAVGACVLLGFLFLIDRPPTPRRLVAGGTALSLAVLLRPDSVLLVAVALGVVAIRSRDDWRQLARSAVLVLLPQLLVILYVLWRRTYFGDWLPNTYYAKAAIPLDIRLSSGTSYALWSLIACAPIVGFALAVPASRVTAMSLTVIWTAAVAIVGGDSFPLARFLVPILPVLASLPAVPAKKGLALTAILAVTMNAALLTTRDVARARHETRLVDGWRTTGEWLRAHTPPETSLATAVIGAIGYYSERHVIDMLGLTDRHIAMRGLVHAPSPPGHRRFDSAYVLARGPELIVLPLSGQVFAPPPPKAWPLGKQLYAIDDLLRHPDTPRLYAYVPVQVHRGVYVQLLCTWKSRTRIQACQPSLDWSRPAR